MESEYEPSSQQNYAEERDYQDFQPRRKKQTKNQQIYGDFYEAYQPEPEPTYPKSYSYNQFKPGATIETYSSDVEVTLPVSKPKAKVKKIVEDDDEQDRPMLGQFSLNSFLNHIGQGQLEDIEQQNQDQSAGMPQGLNDKIRNHLQLVPIGQQQPQETEDLQKMTFEKYMMMGKPKVEPKYKTEEEKQLAKDYNEHYGVGFKMMEKMGFKNINKGLGKNQTGRSTPVEANFKTAFTMKDDHPNKKEKREKSDSQAQDQQQQTQISIPEQLFKYRSRTPKINDFLLDLKQQYEKLTAKIYFTQNEVLAMKNKLEITFSTQVQEQNETKELKEQIRKLEIIGGDLEKCIEYPHLGEHYQIDLLFVRKVYDRLKANSQIGYLHQNAQKELSQLKNALYKFYLAKSKESIKQYQEVTAIEEKMKKNISKKPKKQSNIIDLDNPSDDEVQIVEIGVDEKEKIKKFIDFIITKALVPVVDKTLIQHDTLDRVKDERLIDLVDMIKKFESQDKCLKQLVNNRIYPLYENYLKKINLDDYESEKAKVLPHLIIIPWLHLLKVNQNFNFSQFYKVLAGKLWNLQSSALYNIVTPFLRFSTSKQISYFSNLCLAPRMLYLLEHFSISNPNPTLLNGFTKYSQLLKPEIVSQILESTLFIEVQHVYSKYIKEKEEKEVLKWLKGWKKFSQKISPGKFDKFFEGVMAHQ